MFRQAVKPCRLRLSGSSRTYTSSCNAKRRLDARIPAFLFASAVVATSLVLTTPTVHNDGPSDKSSNSRREKVLAAGKAAQVVDNGEDALNTLIWGSNRSLVLDPGSSGTESFPRPAVASWLKNVALRDLVLHQKHAACVDARGDVYQWGEGFFGPEQESMARKPTLTLRGKNIIGLQLTEGRVYALSASGRVYVLASEAAKQVLPAGKPTPASTPWWSTGWMWGEEENTDFAEITPNSELAWGEKFVTITAGNHHLLALTSKGRTFAHPISRHANDYGQLGMRKIDLPEHPGHVRISPHPPRRSVELLPKSAADPYAKATPYTRPPPPISASSTSDLAGLDDGSITFCDRLFEVPSLKGVEVAQIAAGGRSSYVRTSTGRVLGWGANEFGQIGLGNTRLETVIVPTEVVLWQYTSARTNSKCLDVTAGGDLTCFSVERQDGSKGTTIDVLMCGNGQYGGLGNNQYSNAQGAPLRAKNVSGLQEYNEASRSLQPIAPFSVSISPTGHVLLALNEAGTGVGGRDLMVWGRNQDFELGNGKRGSSPLPSTLVSSDGQRLMLIARTASEIVDLKGKLWKRGVRVEQQVVAGYGNSVVYWRLC